MENPWGDELTEKYEGKTISDEYEDVVEAIAEKYGIEVNMCDEFEASLILLERPYYREDELEEIEDVASAPERNLSVRCIVTVGIGEDDDGLVVDYVRIDDEAFGGYALGDYDPNERYSEKEQKFIEKVTKELLRKITAK